MNGTTAVTKIWIGFGIATLSSLVLGGLAFAAWETNWGLTIRPWQSPSPV